MLIDQSVQLEKVYLKSVKLHKHAYCIFYRDTLLWHIENTARLLKTSVWNISIWMLKNIDIRQCKPMKHSIQILWDLQRLSLLKDHNQLRIDDFQDIFQKTTKV